MAPNRQPEPAPLPGGAHDTADLVREARHGGQGAFVRLAEMYREEIYRMVYYRTRSPMDAEDLTQDIFLRAFERIGGLRDGDAFRSWLFRIAVNRVTDFQRQKRVLSWLGLAPRKREDEALPEGTAEPEAPLYLEKKEFWENFQKFVKRLSPMEREVFILRFLDHLDIAAIARVLGKKDSTVKTHLYRGLEKFRREEAFMEFGAFRATRAGESITKQGTEEEQP